MHEVSVVQRHRPAFVRRHNDRRAERTVESEAATEPSGRVPRITKLMALAIRFEHLLATGVVRDQGDLAELGHITRARVTQIMNLLHLAPDIQEQILFLPPVIEGRDPIAERHLRPIVAEPCWTKQRSQWRKLRRSTDL